MIEAIHRAPLLRAAKQHPAACAAGGAPLLRLAGAPPSLLVVVVELGRDAHEYRNVVAKAPPGREGERRERWRANERCQNTEMTRLRKDGRINTDGRIHILNRIHHMRVCVHTSIV